MSKTTQRISTLFAAMALAGVASYSLAAEPIKIALAGPVTGPVAQYGDMQSMGALMAIEQINKAGGVNGSMLEAVTYDDACDPKQAVAVANKIVKTVFNSSSVTCAQAQASPLPTSTMKKAS